MKVESDSTDLKKMYCTSCQQKKYNIKLKDVLVALSFIDLPTIATAIVGRVISLWGAIQKRSNEPMYKTKN